MACAHDDPSIDRTGAIANPELFEGVDGTPSRVAAVSAWQVRA
jgi:hypothetical protein